MLIFVYATVVVANMEQLYDALPTRIEYTPYGHVSVLDKTEINFEEFYS